MSEAINFDNFKVRCSAIGKVMADSRDNPQVTEKQSVLLAELEKKETLTKNQAAEMARLRVLKANKGKIILSDTCIEYLMEVYAWETAKKIPVNKESMDLLQIRKGKQAEWDSIELLSIVDDYRYEKNDEQVSNDFLTGEPDVYRGQEILKSEALKDTKSIWDYPTYLKTILKPIEPGYDLQIKGYGDICSCSDLEVVKVLVNTPDDIIEEMKYRIAKKFGAVTTESPDFLREWAKWEHSMRFDDIRIEERVHKVKVEPFTETERQRVYDRVKVCRQWLNIFHEQRIKLN